MSSSSKLVMKIAKYKKLTPLLLILGILLSLTVSSLAPTDNAGASAASKQAYKTFAAKCKKQPAKTYSICKKTGPSSDPEGDLLKLCKELKNKNKTNSAAYKAGENCNKIISDASSGGGSGGGKGGGKGGSGGGPTGPFSLSASDLGLESSPTDLKSILNGVYSIAGGVAVLMIVISGLLMAVNGDNPQNVAAARKSIIFTAVGLVVIIMAFVLTNVVLAVV